MTHDWRLAAGGGDGELAAIVMGYCLLGFAFAALGFLYIGPFFVLPIYYLCISNVYLLVFSLSDHGYALEYRGMPLPPLAAPVLEVLKTHCVRMPQCPAILVVLMK